MKIKQKSGFTLIELMIVVVIIGILAAMAIPRFMSASVRSKQSEAKLNLKQVYNMQRTFRQGIQVGPSRYGDNGVTATAGGRFIEIGVEIMVPAAYTYVMVANGNSFSCTATANIDDDATIDTWVIDETGNLVNTIDDVNS